MRSIDRFRGCMIGGAAGDALGYAVEFMSEKSIFNQYGSRGITEYQLTGSVAQISDDTQMTLFTAAGLLHGATRGVKGPWARYIAQSYWDWLKTQTENYPLPGEERHSWLVDVPELFSRRAPGNTCLSALLSGETGSVAHPINHSKGCGGVMRVAPIGLYFNDRRVDIAEVDRVGAEAAAITHGHPLGYIPAAALVHIVHRLSQNDAPVAQAIREAIDAMSAMWPPSEDMDWFTELMEKALYLAARDVRDPDAICQLGEGWVGEEALAIAAYCAAKYPEDFDRAMIAAVNHSGDSDSTGAVAGNILGAHLGLSGIPEKYTDHLELKDVILEVADDLWHDCRIGAENRDADPEWEMKYFQNRRPPRV
ncbi:MAG: ADP-ribosylglycohydrolase family protein [Clostridia bacterium]|nr:ADP-ribosylglycohydrolase family protein [Clostridia bacterium]